MASLLGRRTGPVASALFECVAAEARRWPSAGAVVSAMLGARDGEVRERAMGLAAELAREGRLEGDGSLLEQIAQLAKLGDAVAVGPVLLGTRRPFHVLQHGSSAEDLVNVAAVGVVRAAEEKRLRDVEPRSA